jgi:hypothetical protein
VFEEVLKADLPNMPSKTGYEKPDKVLAALEELCKSVKTVTNNLPKNVVPSSIIEAAPQANIFKLVESPNLKVCF